jgi:hypothetical protein
MEHPAMAQRCWDRRASFCAARRSARRGASADSAWSGTGASAIPVAGAGPRRRAGAGGAAGTGGDGDRAGVGMVGGGMVGGGMVGGGMVGAGMVRGGEGAFNARVGWAAEEESDAT